MYIVTEFILSWPFIATNATYSIFSDTVCSQMYIIRHNITQMVIICVFAVDDVFVQTGKHFSCTKRCCTAEGVLWGSGTGCRNSGKLD